MTEQEEINQLSIMLVHALELIGMLRHDKQRLDWCESIAAKYPRLENDGLTPMTRKSIDASMLREDGKA